MLRKSTSVPLAVVAIIGLSACQHVSVDGVAPTAEKPLAAAAGINISATAATGRAERALADGQLGKARDGFNAALRANPNSVPAGLGLAETYLAMGDHDTALRLFDAVERWATGQDRGRIAQGRGLIALQREQVSEARSNLRTSVELDASLWRAWIGLGRLHARLGEEQAARAAFAKAQSSAPNLGTVMNDIGMSYLLERQPKKAISYLERALVVESGLQMARGNLRIARAMDRQYDMAVSGSSPDELADTLNNVGYIAIINGDFDIADRYLRRALEVSPVYHEAAVANLNLLAHAQISGERPEPAALVGRAADRGSDAVERPSEPVAALADTQPETPTMSLARDGERQLQASAKGLPLSEDVTGDAGFRWEETTSSPSARSSSTPVSPAPAPVQQEAVSSTAARSSLGAPSVPVSDTVELETFIWADPTAPLAAGVDPASVPEVEGASQRSRQSAAPRHALKEPNGDSTFRWAN